MRYLRLLCSIGDITCDELWRGTIGGQMSARRWGVSEELFEDVLGFLCLRGDCVVDLKLLLRLLLCLKVVRMYASAGSGSLVEGMALMLNLLPRCDRFNSK